MKRFKLLFCTLAINIVSLDSVLPNDSCLILNGLTVVCEETYLERETAPHGTGQTAVKKEEAYLV